MLVADDEDCFFAQDELQDEQQRSQDVADAELENALKTTPSTDVDAEEEPDKQCAT